MCASRGKSTTEEKSGLNSAGRNDHPVRLGSLSGANQESADASSGIRHQGRGGLVVPPALQARAPREPSPFLPCRRQVSTTASTRSTDRLLWYLGQHFLSHHAGRLHGAVLSAQPADGYGSARERVPVRAASGRAKKIRASLRRPGRPSILTGPVHPFGSLAALNRPPSDGQEPIALRPHLTMGLPLSRTVCCHRSLDGCVAFVSRTTLVT